VKGLLGTLAKRAIDFVGWLNEIRLAIVFAAAIPALSLCLITLSSAFAQPAILEDLKWKRDGSTGDENAASRSDPSFNFFDIGDLSYYSQYLVEQDLARISTAAGLTIERSPTKSSSILIFHDTNVFSRLKNDKAAFLSLGIPDSVIKVLEEQASKSETTKCVTLTVTDAKNNITGTAILLSEKFDDCLLRGLLDSFGIGAAEISVKTLVDVCVLYEGRRRSLRNRQSLSQEIPRLRDLCLAKAEVAKRQIP
jgi:hypothetical protein